MKNRYITTLFCLFIFAGSFAQELANFAGREPVISPEIKGTEITFRILAPYAATVKLYGSWMKDMNSAVELKKNEKDSGQLMFRLLHLNYTLIISLSTDFQLPMPTMFLCKGTEEGT